LAARKAHWRLRTDWELETGNWRLRVQDQLPGSYQSAWADH
jgi:subtilisin-like proprotein convertase family protein